VARYIVQLVDSSGFGGIESHILELSAALRARNIPVIVVLMADYGPHPLHARLTAAGVRWYRNGTGYTGLLRWLYRHARLINTHGYKAGIVGRLFGAMMRIPVVSTWHSGDSGAGRLAFYQWLDTRTAALAPAVAVSQPIAAALPVPARVIQNFVSPAPCESAATGKIAFVGRLSREKGPDTFCRLIDRLGYEAAVYGDGPMLDLLQQRYGQRLTFYGQVEDMADRWRDIELLCITSRAEGLPMVALEAMSRGIPVIAFALGGLTQLIMHGRTGWLVPPGDLDGFQSALQSWRAMGATERQQMGSAARARIQTQYSADAVVPRILEVYQEAQQQ